MFQILIADDEPNIREGVRQFITSQVQAPLTL